MVTIYLVLLIAFGAGGAVFGHRKGRIGAGFFFGLVLGPIGWLLVALGPDKTPRAAELETSRNPPYRIPAKYGNIGAVIAGILCFIFLFLWKHNSLGAPDTLPYIVFLSALGALLGALLGAIVGFVRALSLPKEKTKCIKWGSPNVVASYKSIIDGEVHPNRCPDCKAEW